MIKSMFDFLTAKKIVDDCHVLALYDKNPLPPDAGLYLSFSPIECESGYEKIIKETGRHVPYIWYNESRKEHFIELQNIKMQTLRCWGEYSDKKEMPGHFIRLCEQNFQYNNYVTDNLTSPSIPTLYKRPKFWRELIEAEGYFKYWSISTRFPGFAIRPYHGLKTYLNQILCVRQMLKFERETKKKVVVFKCYSERQPHRLTPLDMKFGYWIHKKVFNDRLVGVFFYNSSNLFGCNGADFLR